MSHSQFHSINLFILRHAWLNLLDKHMTTGRINQVTILQRMSTALPAHCAEDFTRASRRNYVWLLKQNYSRQDVTSAVETLLEAQSTQYSPFLSRDWVNHAANTRLTAQSSPPFSSRPIEVVLEQARLPQQSKTAPNFGHNCCQSLNSFLKVTHHEQKSSTEVSSATFYLEYPPAPFQRSSREPLWRRLPPVRIFDDTGQLQQKPLRKTQEKWSTENLRDSILIENEVHTHLRNQQYQIPYCRIGLPGRLSATTSLQHIPVKEE